MRFLLACLATIAAAGAQSAVVSTLADSGPGSLRAALSAANASGSPTFTIDVAASATAGPIVLASMLPFLTRSNVTIRASSSAGRLVIDARPPTVSSGYGLYLGGNNIQVLAPCRVLVRQANGVVVRGSQARFSDLEVIGNLVGAGLVTLAGANDLVLGRFVADGFHQGLHLQGCSRARVADDGVSMASMRNCTFPGLLITDGSDHVIGSFVCTANEMGVFATNSPGLLLGRPTGPRSLASGNSRVGIQLVQCSGAVLTNADVLGNGIGPGGLGLQVSGGTGVVVSDLRAEGNRSGLQFAGGMSNLRIGPNVSTRGVSGTDDVGIGVYGAADVTIVGSSFGPDHHNGVLLAPEAVGIPTNVTFCRCTIHGNRGAGVWVLRSSNTLVCSSLIAGNTGGGIEALGSTLASGPHTVAIADCVVSANAGNGVTAQFADGVQVGPGNRIDDNLYGGVEIAGSSNSVVRDNLSIDRNRVGGIWMVDCNNAVVARSALNANRGRGIYAARCSGLAIGPDVAVRDTVGTGVQLEGPNGCRVFSSQITASTAHGVHVLAALGAPGTAPHVFQSCLIADHPGLALFCEDGPPVNCELCTITGNLRGVDTGTNLLTIDSCIVYANVLQDLQPAPTVTVRNTFYQNPPPTAGSTNTSADPQFVSAAARDWRLQPASPAIGYANQAIAIAPGALDAYGGPRVVGPLDAGAFEAGPHPMVSQTRLLLSSAVMPNGGGGLAFHVQYPSTAAGTSSILLMELGPPSGSFAAYGAVIPLAMTTEILLAAQDPESVATIATVGPDGVVAGALLWAGRIPASIRNQVVSLCAVAYDSTPVVRGVSNVAMFTIL